MSFQAFSTMFEAAADRLTEIKLLVSESDATTGIINEDTDCDKAYWENVGPTSNTGTGSAAIIDLYRVLNALEDGAVVTLGFGDNLIVNNDGVGVGVAPDSQYNIMVGAKGLHSTGLIYSEGTAYFGGQTIFGDHLDMAVGKEARLASFDLRLTETVHAGTIGVVKQVFSIDQTDGSLVFTNRYDGTDKWEVDVAEGLAGDFLIRANDGTPRILFDTQSANTTLHIIGKNVSLSKPYGRYDVFSDPQLSIIGDSTASVYLMTDDATAGTQRIYFRQITADPVDTWWGITRNFASGGTVDTLTFELEGDKILELSDSTVHVLSSSGFDTRMYITTTASKTAEFFEFAPNLQGPANRGDLGGDTYGPAMRFGWTDGYVGNIGLDGLEAWASIRIWFDDTSDANTKANVAIGKPLGDYLNPIDALNVMDTPFLVAINADHRYLTQFQSTREGLWIGLGDAASVYKSARITLQDQTGERSAIQWGIEEEPFTQFVKDGVSKLTTIVGSNNYGGTVHGFTAVPNYETTSDLTIDMATIEAEIQASVSEINPGAAVLVEDTNSKVELWMVTPDGLNWARFESLGTLIAVS